MSVTRTEIPRIVAPTSTRMVAPTGTAARNSKNGFPPGCWRGSFGGMTVSMENARCHPVQAKTPLRAPDRTAGQDSRNIQNRRCSRQLWMKRLRKPLETSRSAVQQKTGVVRSPNGRRLGIPAMRFNHVNGDPLTQQHPQILRTCARSPVPAPVPCARATVPISC